jgi:plasmid stabilization system protein ParE
MAHEIIWTPAARADFELITAYLKEEWSTAIANRFVLDSLRKIELLAESPRMGVASRKDPSVRRILLSRHVSLYYGVQSDLVFLLSVVDNRQNPERNPF